jgi:hypothetical protein
MKKTLFSKLGFAFITISLLFLFPVSAQENDYWKWGMEFTSEQSGQIWGYNNTLYHYSRSWGSNTPISLLKWDLDGGLLLNKSSSFNYSAGAPAYWDMTGYQDSLYTCGNVHNDTSGTNGWIAKWDNNWTQIWNRTWITNDSDLFTRICADENGVSVCGYNKSFDTSEGWSKDWIVVKYDTEGNQLWNTSWGTENELSEPAAIWLDGSDVFVIGESYFPGKTFQVLVKYGSDGTHLWDSVPEEGVIKSSEMYDIWGDENFIYTCGEDNGQEETVLVKWTPDGNIVWQKSYTYRRDKVRCRRVIGDETNIFTVGDRYKEDHNGENEISVLRWIFEGELEAETYFSITEKTQVNDIWASEDYIFVAGYCYMNMSDLGLGDTDAFIAKIPKNFALEKIPGYSIIMILGIMSIGVSLIVLKTQKKIEG